MLWIGERDGAGPQQQFATAAGIARLDLVGQAPPVNRERQNPPGGRVRVNSHVSYPGTLVQEPRDELAILVEIVRAEPPGPWRRVGTGGENRESIAVDQLDAPLPRARAMSRSPSPWASTGIEQPIAMRTIPEHPDRTPSGQPSRQGRSAPPRLASRQRRVPNGRRHPPAGSSSASCVRFSACSPAHASPLLHPLFPYRHVRPVRCGRVRRRAHLDWTSI
jgi:hypothetical protein